MAREHIFELTIEEQWKVGGSTPGCVFFPSQSSESLSVRLYVFRTYLECLGQSTDLGYLVKYSRSASCNARLSERTERAPSGLQGSGRTSPSLRYQAVGLRSSYKINDLRLYQEYPGLS